VKVGSAENKNSKDELSKKRRTKKKSKKKGFLANPFNLCRLLNVSYCLFSCVICIICVVCAIFIDNQAVLIFNDFDYVCMYSMSSMYFCFCPCMFLQLLDMHQIWSICNFAAYGRTMIIGIGFMKTNSESFPRSSLFANSVL